MKFTQEQETILAQQRTVNSNHLVVEAYAGCAKSTTKIAMVNQIPEQYRSGVLVTSHNRHIVHNDLPFLPTGVRSQTLHALGMSMLYKAFNPGDYYLQPRKYEYILWDVLKDHGIWEPKQQREYVAAMLPLVDKARCHLIHSKRVSEVARIIEYHNIDLPCTVELAQVMLNETLKRGRREANKRIDFTDQLWIPHTLQLSLGQKFHTVIGDEWQDANACHIALLKIIAGKAKTVFYGDSHQAIYSFAGADGTSMDRMKHDYQADTLPLSVCFRCPTSHLDLARTIVPGIQDGRSDRGIVEKVTVHDVINTFRPKPNDAFVCRTNKPLMRLAYQFIERKIPVHFVGRDLCNGMLDIVDKVVGYGKDKFDEFGMLLEKYKQRKLEHLLQKQNNELAVASICDRIDSLDILYDAADNEGISTVKEFKSWIGDSFEDEHGQKKDSVYMGSVHISKGGEWDTVTVVDHDNLTHPKAKLEHELQSEANLRYIAYTRSKDKLRLMDKEK